MKNLDSGSIRINKVLVAEQVGSRIQWHDGAFPPSFQRKPQSIGEAGTCAPEAPPRHPHPPRHQRTPPEGEEGPRGDQAGPLGQGLVGTGEVRVRRYLRCTGTGYRCRTRAPIPTSSYGYADTGAVRVRGTGELRRSPLPQ